MTLLVAVAVVVVLAGSYVAGRMVREGGMRRPDASPSQPISVPSAPQPTPQSNCSARDAESGLCKP